MIKNIDKNPILGGKERRNENKVKPKIEFKLIA